MLEAHLAISAAYAGIALLYLVDNRHRRLFNAILYGIIVVGSANFAFEWVSSNLGKLIAFIVGSAHAAPPTGSPIASADRLSLGLAVNAIIGVMLIMFATAAFLVMTLKDTPENRERRAAADSIVKTFGGFFIGLLTSTVKQSIGV
jgi:hypothetical protein